MTVPISINTDDITSQFDVNSQQIETILDGVAKQLGLYYFTKLEENINRELHSTRRQYLQNLKLVDSGKLQSTILLDYSKDKLVKMIEEGSSAFDMKSNMLSSPKAKTSKSGKKYLSVPFRWATPGSLGESEVFSGKMSEEIYQQVRKKEQSVTKPNVTQPLTSNDIVASGIPQHLQLGSRKEVSNETDVFREYKHKSSIYEGITRTTDRVTGQSVYNSFRRVSENSDPEAFIHPGITAKNFLNNTLNEINVEDLLGNMIDNELSKLGF
jgi:hypothetical protein